jgi:hypothetical protein
VARKEGEYRRVHTPPAEGLTQHGTASLTVPPTPHLRAPSRRGRSVGPRLGDPNSSAATPSVRVSLRNNEQQQGERKMNGTTTPNGHHAPHAPHQERHDDTTAPTEAEVQAIVQSIRDASTATSVAATSSRSPELHTPKDETPSQPPQSGGFDVGEYWDLPSMAPLNQASRVST